MKKVVFMILAGCLLVTGCENDSKEITNKESDYSVYEYHYYDEDFNHTEDFIVKYDKNGNFKELKTITLYDKDKRSCNQDSYTVEKYPDLAYKGVSATCTSDSNGVSYISTMTDESVQDGYLSDEDGDYLLPLKYFYEELSTQDKADETFNGLIDSFKENNVKEDSRNYIIIKGKKTSW